MGGRNARDASGSSGFYNVGEIRGRGPHTLTSTKPARGQDDAAWVVRLARQRKSGGSGRGGHFEKSVTSSGLHNTSDRPSGPAGVAGARSGAAKE